MTEKDLMWLKRINDATNGGSGMYPGWPCDMLPRKVARRLGEFIDLFTPHNPVHKERWVINSKGREFLGDKP